MATNKLVALRDFSDNSKRGARVQFFDQETGWIYKDPEGKNKVRQLSEVDYICADKAGNPLKSEDDRIIPLSELSDAAAKHYYGMSCNATGQKMKLSLSTPNEDGKLVTMDLSPSAVHTAATLPVYVGGYSIVPNGIADAVSPVMLVPHEQDVYFTWNEKNDFNRKLPSGAAHGGSVSMVNPTLSSTAYAAVPYALGGFIPTEVQANADTPLRPYEKLVQMVVDGLRLEREIRVANLLETTGNWNANMLTTILAGSQWNGGPNADPLANLHHAIEQSLMDVTAIVMSGKAKHELVRSPAMQKFFGFKDGVPGIPTNEQLSATLDLPKIITGHMKYFVGGAPTYVWGNDVVLIRQPPQMPPMSQMDNVTSMTFRWSGLSIGDNKVPDGSVTGGFLVRSYFDQRRGPRGSTVVVVTHSDIEVQTSGLLGGLLHSVLQ